MFYDTSQPFAQLEARRSHLEAQRENSARHARFFSTYTTRGIGETKTTTAIEFAVSFVHEPSFTCGTVLDSPLVTGQYPRAHAGVYDWHVVNDLYVGVRLAALERMGGSARG